MAIWQFYGLCPKNNNLKGADYIIGYRTRLFQLSTYLIHLHATIYVERLPRYIIGIL